MHYYDTVISECHGNNTRTLSYVWKSSRQCKIGTLQLPPPITDIDCSYTVPTSGIAIGMDVITAMGAAASIVYAIGFTIYRDRAAIKAATFGFCQVIFFGSLFLYVSVFIQAGTPTTSLCIARPWFLALGFGFLFGGLLVKMMRIYAIFNAGQANKPFEKKDYSLTNMLKRLAVIVVGEIAVLVALTVVGSPGVNEKLVTIRGVGSYYQLECSAFNQISMIVLLAFNALLIIYGSYIAWRSRAVPDAFNETKFVAVAILFISFTAVVVIPVLLTLSNGQSQYLLQSLAINFATVVSMSVFAVPKLYAGYENITPKTSNFMASSGPKMSTRGMGARSATSVGQQSANGAAIPTSSSMLSVAPWAAAS
ncbi:hypothetical protein HK102_005494 [Quaeritorhiza haematococci]|nr:hypothetical protein HK102_005494 [Quaeritorhiza haematococci]